MPKIKKTKTKEWEEKYDFPAEKYGIKHLIECNCVLPQFKNMKNPIWHKFPVFSIIDENNNVIPKFVQCNNCGIIHNVIEIGISNITTKENIKSIRKIDDVKVGLPDNIVGILEQHNCDINVWEEVEFIIENEKWGSSVVITAEDIEGEILGKILIIKSSILVKIESYSRQETIV